MMMYHHDNNDRKLLMLSFIYVRHDGRNFISGDRPSRNKEATDACILPDLMPSKKYCNS